MEFGIRRLNVASVSTPDSRWLMSVPETAGASLSSVWPVAFLRQQHSRGGGLGAVLPKSDHFAVDDVGEHRPQALALPALDLIESEMPRAPFRARPIPLGQKGPARRAGLCPSSPMADRGVTRGHRLTIHADLLPQAPGDARLRIRELTALGPNPTAATDDAALRINERHGMRCPRQIVPGALLHRPHAADPSTTSTAGVSPPVAFQMHPKSSGPAVVRTLNVLTPEIRASPEPTSIAPRSHGSSLVGSTSERTTPGGPVPSGIARSSRKIAQ